MPKELEAYIRRQIERACRISHAIEDHCDDGAADPIFEVINLIADEMEHDPIDDDVIHPLNIGLFLGMLGHGHPRP